jgi:hypothetical protein
MRNCGGGASHRRRLRFQFQRKQGSGVDAEAPDSFLMARWSYCGPWLELKGTGAVDPRRSKWAAALGLRWQRRGLELGFRGGWGCYL